MSARTFCVLKGIRRCGGSVSILPRTMTSFSCATVTLSKTSKHGRWNDSYRRSLHSATAVTPLTDSDSPDSSSSDSASSQQPLTLADLPTIKCCRMTNLFMPYLTSPPNRGAEEDDSKNNRLLVDNGFVFPSQKGMFHFLPLGMRVLDKLKRVIVEELENVGCQELAMSTLTHSRLWQQSGRWDDAGAELYRLTDRRDNQLCLAPTCEENITAMMSEIRHHISFKHLPIKLFQISTKYRDEATAKNGLLRGREFLMKDLYTFDQDEATALSTYSAITSAYERIFSRLSLPVYRVVGSPGKIGGRLSHEFQLPSVAGEDEIIVCQSCGSGINVELIDSEEEKNSWKCECGDFKALRTPSIELGHTFLLGLKYSKPFGSTYRDPRGKDALMEMGCYGIGVSRLIAACAEVSNPATGAVAELVWPRALAPFSVGILPPKKGSKEASPEVVDAALQLAVNLSSSASSSSSSEVLVDDRVELTIGRRARDLRRIGVPFIVVVGGKFKNEGLFELIDVYANKSTYLPQEELRTFLESH